MLIDTHAHLNFTAFEKDRNKVIKKCLENNLWMINVGTNLETSKRAIEIAQNYSQGVFAAIGLHPINLDTGLVKIKVDTLEGRHFEKEFDFEKYEELAKSEKLIAIGEIGLDYYWKPKTTRKKQLFKQRQKDLLLKELNLVKKLKLPVIFHCRMAHQDLIEFLLEHPEIRPERAVAHGFVGNLEELQKYLNFGFYIGFNGIIFKKIEGINFEENIKKTPLDRILIETDCPYLSPPEFQGQRNEPFNVRYIAQRIAEVKNIRTMPRSTRQNLDSSPCSELTFDKIAEITTENAKRLFKL